MSPLGPSNGLLLVSAEATTVSSVASALEKNGDFTSTSVCRTLRDLTQRLEAKPTRVVIFDLDTHENRALLDLEPIISRHPETRFIVLCASRSDGLLLEAMQVGARHLLLKSSIPHELAGVVQRLLPGDFETAALSGRMITVLPASGGCGATTVAVNLAHEIHTLASGSTLLVDLDEVYGAVATYLSIAGQYGIADVLADPSRIDPQLIRSTAVPYREKFEVLLSSASTTHGEPAPSDYEHLGAALRSCKRAYTHVVVDGARVSGAAAEALARESEVTLIVFQLSVKDIRRVRLMRAALMDLGVSAEAIRPVANRFRRRYSMISSREAEEALGGVTITKIRNDFRSAVRGLNYGQPLAVAAPRSVLRRDLREVAEELVQLHMPRQTHRSYGRSGVGTP